MSTDYPLVIGGTSLRSIREVTEDTTVTSDDDILEVTVPYQASQNEEWLLTREATGGTFTLAWGGNETDPIPYNEGWSLVGYYFSQLLPDPQDVDFGYQGQSNSDLQIVSFRFVNGLGGQDVEDPTIDLTNMDDQGTVLQQTTNGVAGTERPVITVPSGLPAGFEFSIAAGVPNADYLLAFPEGATFNASEDQFGQPLDLEANYSYPPTLIRQRAVGNWEIFVANQLRYGAGD